MKSLQGKVNQLTGRVAEDMFATELRNKKQIVLSSYFAYKEPLQSSETETLPISNVKTRFFIQADEGHPKHFKTCCNK